MKITPSLIDKMIRLRSGESLPSSALRGDWVEELLADGVLVSRSHGSRRTLVAASAQSLERGLAHIDERLADLDRMKEMLMMEVGSRSQQAEASGNSKLVPVRSCPGFPVNSFEPIPCRLNGKDFEVHSHEGSFLFVADWQSFVLPQDITIVNVENMENFRLIRRQRALFASVLPGQRLLFVSRYPQSSDLRRWLLSVSNPYVHFGDFDFAGIHIFLTEFHKHLSERSSFLVPHDIEQSIMHGSAERYHAQYHKFRYMSTDIPELQHLMGLFDKYHRCYDQEGYIDSVSL
mgnify:FL=1